MPEPKLIAIGGFPGAGKSTAARRLSRELGIPRLGSDYLGRTIRTARPDVAEPHRLGFAVLFAMAEDFLSSDGSVIVDTNMGWEFQWERLDVIVARQQAAFLPIILRCPQAVYLHRIAERHRADPERNASVEKMRNMPQFAGVCEFLEQLDRPDAHDVDASGDPDDTYARVRQIVSRSAVGDFAGSG